MLATPSRPADFAYCPILGHEPPVARRSSEGALERIPRRWGAFANDRFRPPGIPNLEHALTSLFLILS